MKDRTTTCAEQTPASDQRKVEHGARNMYVQWIIPTNFHVDCLARRGTTYATCWNRKYGAKCCTTVHIRSSAGVKRTVCWGAKDNWVTVRNWRNRIKTFQIKMAVVIRIIYVTVIIVFCEHVLGQSLSLGKCPSYPAIKKLDLKKVCTIKSVSFIFLIYKTRSFPGFHLFYFFEFTLVL